MLTLTSQYALKAMIQVARHGGKSPISGKRIAKDGHIPPKYLSMVLSELVRVGVLGSTRGKGGGFRLSRTAPNINLYEIISCFEPVLFAQRPCPFGNVQCSDSNPCAAHDDWKQVRDAQSHFLKKTSLHDITKEQRRISKARKKGRNHE